MHDVLPGSLRRNFRLKRVQIDTDDEEVKPQGNTGKQSQDERAEQPENAAAACDAAPPAQQEHTEGPSHDTPHKKGAHRDIDEGAAGIRELCRAARDAEGNSDPVRHTQERHSHRNSPQDCGKPENEPAKQPHGLLQPYVNA